MAVQESAELGTWIARQLDISKRNLARAISATTLRRERPEFGQHVVPVRGSVLASPVIANWDPEPDYFFHWTRDAATVMRAIVDLQTMLDDVDERRAWLAHFHDIVDFSLAVVDSSTLKPASPDYRARTQANCRRFLRSAADVRGVQGDKLLAEPRFNPDGSVDILKWSRPQLDGPALRALSCLAYLAEGGKRSAPVLSLLQRDLDFTLRNAGRRSIGPWEEPQEFAWHYHVALVQLGALVRGRAFASDDRQWLRAEKKLRRVLEQHWLPQHETLVAMRNTPSAVKKSSGDTGEKSAAQLVDSAILLAIIDADLPEPLHSVLDARAVSTLDILAQTFAAAFPINHHLPADHAPALGRSLDDRYFGGNAWYVTTLGAAAFCFRRAIADAVGHVAWCTRGDAWMKTLQRLIPADGSMTEQIDRTTGLPRSARHLTWNYAAFISTARLRNRAFALH